MKVADAAMDQLVKYNWPGNVRELEHTVKRLVTLSRSTTIRPSDIHFKPIVGERELPQDLQGKIEALEKREIVRALENASWVQTRAAESLGISERVLRYKMRKYGIKRP